MREIKYNELSKELLNQLQKGAFLNVKDNDGNVNTMTIAWGNLGFMWNKPAFTAMVRYSRHTYKLIENAKDFSVSFPLKGQLKEALSICGTKSGRDIDKFKESNIHAVDSKNINSPIIEECDLHIECKIVYKQEMDPKCIIDSEIKEKKYSTEDYHVLYYGEIVGTYIND